MNKEMRKMWNIRRVNIVAYDMRKPAKRGSFLLYWQRRIQPIASEKPKNATTAIHSIVLDFFEEARRNMHKGKNYLYVFNRFESLVIGAIECRFDRIQIAYYWNEYLKAYGVKAAYEFS